MITLSKTADFILFEIEEKFINGDYSSAFANYRLMQGWIDDPSSANWLTDPIVAGAMLCGAYALFEAFLAL